MIGAEHASIAGGAGDRIALVDGREVKRVPLAELRAECEPLARRDRSGEQVEAAQGQFLALRTRYIGLCLRIEETHFYLAAVDAASRVGFLDRQIDRALYLIAEIGISPGQGSRHADADRFPGLRIRKSVHRRDRNQRSDAQASLNHGCLPDLVFID